MINWASLAVVQEASELFWGLLCNSCTSSIGRASAPLVKRSAKVVPIRRPAEDVGRSIPAAALFSFVRLFVQGGVCGEIDR